MDRAFFHTPDAPPSPLGSRHLLLVCKRWLRIGIPLLYVSLWLSSDAHTHTLLRVLAAHPELGASVRDLRLDGGFVPELHDVVLRMPNVRNVHLSWVAGRGCSTAGLWDAMPALRPRRLWLGPHDYVEGGWGEVSGLMGLLGMCLSEKWDTLEFVYLVHWYPMLRGMAEALRCAPALKYLSIHAEDVYNWSWSADSLSFLDRDGLQTVWCRSPDDRKNTEQFLEKGGVNKRIMDMLTIVGEDGLSGSSLLRPSPEGMRMLRF